MTKEIGFIDKSVYHRLEQEDPSQMFSTNMREQVQVRRILKEKQIMTSRN